MPTEARDGEAPACALELEPDIVEVFDELYERVYSSRGFDEAFVGRMNAVDARLQGPLRQARRHLRQALRE